MLIDLGVVERCVLIRSKAMILEWCLSVVSSSIAAASLQLLCGSLRCGFPLAGPNGAATEEIHVNLLQFADGVCMLQA